MSAAAAASPVDTAAATKALVRLMMTDIKDKRFTFSSAMDLIVKTMQLVEKIPQLVGPQKKQVALAALDEIAKGADGIAGTEDDLIPGYIMEALHFMLVNQLADQIIDTLIAAAKGAIQFAAPVVAAAAAPLCAGIFGACCGK